jgi:hypothetical protein
MMWIGQAAEVQLTHGGGLCTEWEMALVEIIDGMHNVAVQISPQTLTLLLSDVTNRAPR